MNKKDLIDYREMNVEDLPFIFSTWTKGMLNGNEYYRIADRKSFTDNFHNIIRNKLSNPEVVVMVACLKESPDVILGYSINQRIKNKNVLHWVYVKKEWRLIGLAKDLLPTEVHATSCMTKLGLKIKPKAVIYDPFL